MRSLFNENEFREIRQRVASLHSNNVRKWGKMQIAQMMAHCSIGFEKATGKLPFEDKSNLLMRTLVKKIVLNAVKKGDLGQNQKTFPDYQIADERDFDTEKKRLLENLDAFYQMRAGTGPGRHPYFGKFSKEDWGALQYLHTDHHLKQFSA
ncbi:DUF1569 domain-containing protein [Puia dinghuensis]|uniref:DUF1569 domain-containing protein n=1 Tax=Puia dinghuensis TaxID=1792502 RepID=A0A8J2UGL4_9BACT|nr:DUF1569 domain-containing protein [Puia dinghuensis]GGB12707.1 hypothetical protein GCM10011511_40440 [Puia dinghuensis]